ncbi:MAG TPA: NAD-dependent succinate-semialdehyde dehydrogenase [Caulobacteraceae bacterium]|jgi:succinate-semialdehyde dehydrogenase/glutarate-semialdehyde dehydrogenase|nr:NAD-dependent succinate-semialdehyde dehydrogenase [Caulobacteraceae bacterium]
MNPIGLADPALLRTQAFIDGLWRDAQGGATLRVDNPSTGAPIGFVPDCGIAETAEAIAAADAAFEGWKAAPSAHRGAMLERWGKLILANAEDLARILTAEQGKPLAEARAEVLYGARFVTWFAEESRRLYGSTIPAPSEDRRILVLKEPVGVSAAITPWNFPIAMVTRKVAPALAAGCPMIVKPSEITPYSALALAELAHRAGVPAGVLSVVTGRPEAIGEALCASPQVRKLSFTGSTRVGAMLMRQCADTVKKLSLELGGNAPFIVFEDADLDLAVAGLIASKFRNAGQTCVCANRILVQDRVYDIFAAKLVAAVAGLKPADGFAEDSTLGPLINAAAVAKVEAHMADALAKGGRRLTPVPGERSGQFVAPIVIGEADASMRLAHEETFGPLAPLFRFGSEDEAVALANATPYGLAAYFYTGDLRRSWRVAERLEAGMIGLNTGNISMEVAPFGGVKQSGFGREGAQLGIEEYLVTKTVHIAGL